MHQRAEIVRPEVVAIRDVLGEVVLHRRADVGEDDIDEVVTIFPALFMPQANRVADLDHRPVVGKPKSDPRGACRQ